MGHFGREAAAALVFAILYFCMFVYMTIMYATKRYKWRSRFTILYIHCLIRVASQACGVAFGVLVWSNVNVFVAYLILGAEGYFSLTISSFYFLKHYELNTFGSSILGPDEDDPNIKLKRGRRLIQAFSFEPIFMPWKFWKTEVIALVDAWLIPANAIIIAGGSMMAGAQSNNLSPSDLQKKMNISKGLRTTGSAIFLALTCLFIVLLGRLSIKVHSTHPAPKYATVAMLFFAVVAVMLFTRGLFGVLQAAIYNLSYYNPANFSGDGFTPRFVALEYVLAVMTEFVAASTLNFSWWVTKHLNGNKERLRGTELGARDKEYPQHDSLSQTTTP